MTYFLNIMQVNLGWVDHGYYTRLCNPRSQNYALIMILQKPPHTSSEELRETLGWTTLKTRRHKAMLSQVHWCLKKETLSYLSCKFCTNSNLNYLTTRGANKIHLQWPNTNFYRSTFEFMGAQAYNNLPQEIRNINSLQIYKRALNGLTH